MGVKYILSRHGYRVSLPTAKPLGNSLRSHGYTGSLNFPLKPIASAPACALTSGFGLALSPPAKTMPARPNHGLERIYFT